MKQRLVAIYIILLLISLSAFADQGGAQALTPAGESLQQDILTGIKTSSRNIQLFHYFRAPSDAANPQVINPYLQDKTNRDGWLHYFFGFRTGAFWDMNNHNTELTNSGPGMYFAIDPSASREFGESSIVLIMPAGTKFLSVTSSIPLRKQTRELLVKENLVPKSQLSSGEKNLGLSRGFSAETLKNMVREENIEFRKLVNEIFARNGIMFIEYQWKSFLAGFCKTPSQSAFVFVGLKPEVASSQQTFLPVSESSALEANEVLGVIPEELKQNFIFFSDFEVTNLTDIEVSQKEVLSRFRNALTRIHEKGTTKAQKYISQNLNDEEITELAEKTYRCERRY